MKMFWVEFVYCLDELDIIFLCLDNIVFVRFKDND